ncbi:MAG: glycosyltransferase [Elainellaceae cyanobacterium]
MNLTVVAMEFPLPPIHGGRADIWRRIVALSNLGVKIQLICWAPELPSEDESNTVNQYVENFYPIVYEKGPYALFRRGLDLLRYPLQVTSRVVRGGQWDNLLRSVKEFSPDIILGDHLHCGLLARKISETLDVPFVLRSHNIEHIHYSHWLESARGMGKLKLMVTLLHLKSYEFSTLKNCLAFYDISIDDLKFWQQQGFNHGKFMPALIDLTSHEKSQSGEEDDIVPSYDIVFLGNLRTENNVEGVLWFLEKVLPLLQKQLPDIKVLIAGSNPIQDIIDTCNACKGVTMKANPISARDTYRSGKVLINPVLKGSGTSIKSIDMFTLQRPIVTLEKGVFGLPAEARQYFKIAADEESFTQLILESLESGGADTPNWEEVQALFGYPIIEEFIKDLEAIAQSSAVAQPA